MAEPAKAVVNEEVVYHHDYMCVCECVCVCVCVCGKRECNSNVSYMMNTYVFICDESINGINFSTSYVTRYTKVCIIHSIHMMAVKNCGTRN